MSNPPTLVFIPGSWHKPICYDKIIKPLQDQHKLKCVAVTLPSTTGNPAATFKDDLDAAQEAISNETSRGLNVVVIAHSYGGLVGNSSIKGFAQPQDAAAGQSESSTTGRVIGLILIASGFTITGMAFMDPFFGRPPPFWRVNNETGFAELITSPRELFYHDLSAEDAKFWVSQLTPQSLKSLFEGGEYSYSGWKDVPAWYIGTVEDRGLPVLVQRIQVGVAREINNRIEHRELQTSHSPFLSQPEATVDIILEAIDAFVGTPKGNESTTRASPSSHLITVPKATLWKPFTWFRFGVPLVLGHVLGRCFVLYTWGRKLWRPRFGVA